ncbi:twin-arginine translocase subunit TatB [Novosphingobium profundi]|uniref:Sec-independent protein translocase protein TatB n=1 Tax=Novosphingobium profundi TaxID=1774954 RepID=UPI001BD940D9|nr:Sec-independent protein translocase protein TatB [Novosphingobium profundi]MBT0670054.1 twin-arginine translocase subunit TatB [Novosphingobium profundi]
MLDIGASELLMIVIVAVVVIGPKDMPLAMRTAGRWIGKMRKITGHFRAGIDAMVREAELEEMEKKWREQNEAIMNAAPKLPSAEDMQAPTRAKTDAEKANFVEDAAGGEPALPAPAEPEGMQDTPASEPTESNLAPVSDPARSAS